MSQGDAGGEDLTKVNLPEPKKQYLTKINNPMVLLSYSLDCIIVNYN